MCQPFLASSFVGGSSSSPVIMGMDMVLITMQVQQSRKYTKFDMKVGPVLPQEIQEKLSHTEEDYFKKHAGTLQSYMSRLDLDLTVDMVPPKDPYIQVRVLDDIGVVLSDGKTTNFARHSMHFLKRTNAEQFILRGLMEELTS